MIPCFVRHISTISSSQNSGKRTMKCSPLSTPMSVRSWPCAWSRAMCRSSPTPLKGGSSTVVRSSCPEPTSTSPRRRSRSYRRDLNMGTSFPTKSRSGRFQPSRNWTAPKPITYICLIFQVDNQYHLHRRLYYRNVGWSDTGFFFLEKSAQNGQVQRKSQDWGAHQAAGTLGEENGWDCQHGQKPDHSVGKKSQQVIVPFIKGERLETGYEGSIVAW